MIKLWIVFGVCLLLARIIDERDEYLERTEANRRDVFATWLLTAILVFFCGLRTWGNDTGTYIGIYEHMTPTLDVFFTQEAPDYSEGMGYILINSILKTMGFSTQNYLMFFAVATVIPYMIFVRRHSVSMLFCVFLMFTTGFYLFTLAALKQCMATGLCLLAVDCALEKKWGRYGFLMFLATMFHPYALVYLLVPLMMFKPWTMRTFVYMGVFIATGFFLESLLGTVLDITDMMGANYDENSFTQEGVNVFRVLVCFVPIFLAMGYGKPLFRGSTREDNLMFNLAMLNALIMFVGLFGTANYFARLANYFLPAQVVVLPWIFQRTHPRDRTWLTSLCVVGYLGYFIYEHMILRPFDTYVHMSLWEYLVHLAGG